MVLLKCHITIRSCAVEQWLDEIRQWFVPIFSEFSKYFYAFFIIFLHHRGNTIDENLEFLDDLLIDI